jgi:hypothetical protein
MNPFTEALEELRQNGWRQGSRGKATGPKCIVGAIQWVRTGSMDYAFTGAYNAPEVLFLNSVLHEMYTLPDLISVDSWNDIDATWPEVEALMEKAALRWDEERAWD